LEKVLRGVSIIGFSLGQSRDFFFMDGPDFTVFLWIYRVCRGFPAGQFDPDIPKVLVVFLRL
jgi:hypothetical protein